MTSIVLKVPYFSQLDNAEDPYGACNATSLAMALHYFGVRGDGSGQLEDQIYRKLVSDGGVAGRPYEMERVVNENWSHIGIQDVFCPDASWEEVRKALLYRCPVVVHGYFTRSGHIACIVGLDDSAYEGRGAWILHDPYGEWCSDGYSHRPGAGKFVRYSYELMSGLCGYSGDLWCHFIEKHK